MNYNTYEHESHKSDAYQKFLEEKRKHEEIKEKFDGLNNGNFKNIFLQMKNNRESIEDLHEKLIEAEEKRRVAFKTYISYLKA